MLTILEQISNTVMHAFEEAGFPKEYGRVGVSNRPDLCDYQCNGAMAAAKALKKKPIDIATVVVEKLHSHPAFEKIEAVMPGFINIRVHEDFLTDFVKKMGKLEKFGYEAKENKKIVIDYGGANVAKPLHVGHLRSAVIGEALKRMGSFVGNTMIGDVHLGDWGLQMGLIIEELRERQPDLVYFDANFTGEYPSEAPFTISELEEIYPAASAKSKVDEAFKERAAKATLLLQNGHKPFVAIWEHIMRVSKADLKNNYDKLNVSFELWKGESDAGKYIPDMIQKMEESGIAYISEGALVVDIAMEGDSKEYPPCIIRKSDGAALYATSDLGTLVEREMYIKPDAYIYVADKRQDLHYTQFFRVSQKAGIVPMDTGLTFIGFGTMNGSDGKPFKTRDGGVMRLEHLIADIQKTVLEKVTGNRDMSEDEAIAVSQKIALSAIKYGDLSNQAGKDYVFDIDRFISFEGNTGPYILYTIVRCKSILNKYLSANKADFDIDCLLPSNSLSERSLKLELTRFADMMDNAWREFAPHKICQYIYSIANCFNSFYHEVKILSEEDETKKRNYLALVDISQKILEKCIDILGFDAPKQM